MKKYKNKRKIIKKYNKDKFYKNGWREPRFSWKTQRFSLETPRFSLKTPYFRGNSKIFIETPDFHWKPQILVGNENAHHYSSL